MATTSKVNLTLMIDRTTKKVIFAEAGKDFVDILFNLLSLPIGTVIKLLKNKNAFGSIDNLYKSLENMDESDLQPNHNKDQLLNPTVTASVLCFHDAKDVSGGNGGVVKQLITYIVTYDLCVKPVSMRSNVKDFGALEKRVVEFGTDKALELLRTSLKSKASLTSVFLMKNGVYEGEGRLRKAVEGRLEVLRRSLMMLMDTQERVRADMDRIVVNTVLNNKAGLQPLAAVEQLNQVPPRVAIHREIIGPGNRKGLADQPAWSRSMSRPVANEPTRLKLQLEVPPYRAIKREADPPQKDRPQWFGTGNKTTVLRVEAKSHRRDYRKQSPSAKRRAVEEFHSEIKVTEQCKKQLSKVAKDLEELKKGKTSEKWDPLKKFYAPFSEEVRKAVLHKKLRLLQEKYSGLTDPRDHLELFYQQMEVQHVSKMAMCRLFPMTFDGVARNWFRKLSPGSITSFSQLTKEFFAHFQGAIPPRKDPFVLQYIRQESEETLRDYLERYHAEVIDMGVFNEKETHKFLGELAHGSSVGVI